MKFNKNETKYDCEELFDNLVEDLTACKWDGVCDYWDVSGDMSQNKYNSHGWLKMNNKEHPELLEGEMFLTNANIDNYRTILFKTKRQGSTAYDKFGYVVNGLFPIFVQKEEHEKYMIDVRSKCQRIRCRLR